MSYGDALASLRDEGYEKSYQPITRSVTLDWWLPHTPGESANGVSVYWFDTCAFRGSFTALVCDDLVHLPNLLAYRRVQGLVDALEQIKKGEGAFSRDPLEHAGNVIEESRRLATEALEAFAKRGG
jgi:hypothetical protein